MSHSERFAAAPDENMSLYALGLNEIYVSLISLMANHDQLSAYQAAGARQSLRSTLDWHALYTSTLRKYFTHGTPPPAIPYVVADPLGSACIKLDRIEDQMLAREIDMTAQQTQMCERLMANLATMVEKLREFVLVFVHTRALA
ncbi:hypothetical protein FRC12_015051 [Ceratobasidium sp. 428]|nr:hypothetical protein FRC12_015051 [Ceratobasidium sp. 428]